MLEKRRGIIQLLMWGRHFGFIMDEKGKKYFFHRNSVLYDFDELREGQKVEFMVMPAPKGPKAIGVRVIDDTDDFRIDIPSKDVLGW